MIVNTRWYNMDSNYFSLFSLRSWSFFAVENIFENLLTIIVIFFPTSIHSGMNLKMAPLSHFSKNVLYRFFLAAFHLSNPCASPRVLGIRFRFSNKDLSITKRKKKDETNWVKFKFVNWLTQFYHLLSFYFQIFMSADIYKKVLNNFHILFSVLLVCTKKY